MGLGGAPLLPLAVALAFGIAIAPWLLVSPLALIASAAALSVSGAAALAGRRADVAMVTLLAGFVVIGAVNQSAPVVPADHIARRALPTRVLIEGRLASEPVRWAPDRARLLLDVEGYRDGADRQPASGRVQLAIFGETVPLGEGQRIAADVRLHRPIGFRNPGGFDYPAQLRREGILLVGNARGDRVIPSTPDVPPWPVAVKRWAVETIRTPASRDVGGAPRRPPPRRAHRAAARDRRGLPPGRRLPRARGVRLQRGPAGLVGVRDAGPGRRAAPRGGARGGCRADRLRPGRRRTTLGPARHGDGTPAPPERPPGARVPGDERARPRGDPPPALESR